VEHPLSTGVGDFTETPCKKLLWHDPRRHVAQSDNCLVIPTTHLQNTCVGNYVLLCFVDFYVPKCANFLCYLCHHGWTYLHLSIRCVEANPNMPEAIHRIPNEAHNFEARGVGPFCRWYGWRPSECNILHTWVGGTPVVREILCTFEVGLLCTASRTSSWRVCWTCSLLARGQESLPPTSVHIHKCWVMRDHAMWIFLYSSASIPISEPYTNSLVNKLQALHLLSLDAVRLQNEPPIRVASLGRLLAPPPPVGKQQTKIAVAHAHCNHNGRFSR
jgi:hypothetical protein